MQAQKKVNTKNHGNYEHKLDDLFFLLVPSNLSTFMYSWNKICNKKNVYNIDGNYHTIFFLFCRNQFIHL